MDQHHLSKTRYTKGLQCELQLWLDCNKPQEKSPYDQATLYIFERGSEMGKAAWGLFPEGVLIAGGDGYLDRDGAVRETLSAIASGATAIYEAAFLYNNVYIFADLFVRNEAGNWDLYEVKSTGSVHEQHKPDIGVQYWVMSNLGYRVDHAFLTYIKGSQGMCFTDPWHHFGFEDLTSTCGSLYNEIARDVTRMNGMVRSSEPDIEMGTHCRKPYDCMFQEYCQRKLAARI